MASGFPSGGAGGGDFYNNFNTTTTAAFAGGGSGMMNNIQLQYRQPQLQTLDQFSSIPPRNNNFSAKRSISDFQQQQQGGLLRSVKQRNQYYNHTSPISPLTPFDFSSGQTQTQTQTQTNYSSPYPQLQQLRSSLLPTANLITNNNNNNNNNNSFYNGYTSYNNNNPSFSSNSFVPNRVVVGLEKSRLQELEKQLLDDNDEDEGDVVSVVTSSEWSETMQNLITPNQNQKPLFSPSPTSSSSSSSASSSSLPSTSSKQSFIDIATAISEGNLEIATAKIDHLKQISNPRGDSEQRLVTYMVSALRSRLNPSQNPPPVTQLSSTDQTISTQMLFEASPCFKLGFMAANLSILEATKDCPTTNVHVLDFDIGQGNQYISLIHAIGERQQLKGIPILIKITSVVIDGKEEEDQQRIVGNRLRKHADHVGIGFKFNIVCKTLSELKGETFFCEMNEALVVNLAYRMYKLSDESVSTENPRDELLRLVKGLSPLVVTLVEQEMNCNTAPFVARVAEVSSYYLALFNSLDSTMTRDGSDRVRIEECLGRKAANSVACEGRDRVERCEVFGKWRARMRMAGFVTRPLGQHVAESMKARLNSVYRNNPGFMVKEEADGVCFGWMDRVLTVASAWC